ncbi:MAG TPA: hypothetical protein PLN52_02830 [Opitutaceae bacterium]|nr:hypothetical protein [Opitutaceae bacterium]
MKLTSLLAAALALAVSSSAVFAAPSSAPADKWLNHYYQNPQPSAIPDVVFKLSRSGYFDQAGQPAQAIGFFSTIFAQNPASVNGWFRDFQSLPEKHYRILASALWYSGNPEGARLLRDLSNNSSQQVRAGIDAMLARGATQVAQTPVLSESSMNLQWGAFLASGDERHITNILAAVGSGQPGVPEAARISLAMNAATHPRVLDICRAQLDKQPNEVRSVLRAAINEAEAKRQPGTI